MEGRYSEDYTYGIEQGVQAVYDRIANNPATAIMHPLPILGNKDVIGREPLHELSKPFYVSCYGEDGDHSVGIPDLFTFTVVPNPDEVCILSRKEATAFAETLRTVRKLCKNVVDKETMDSLRELIVILTLS